MTDLQLALLVIGAVVVVAVFVFNRIQEHRAGRSAERAFRSAAADALLGEPAAPLGGPPAEPRPAPGRSAEPARGALPDERLDYVVELRFAAPVPVPALREQWKPFEHQYAKRAVLAVQAEDGAWARLEDGDGRASSGLHAGLQLVTREGAVGEAALIEFRAAAETLAAATGAIVTAPDMRQAVDRAADLDRFCADTDIQVVLHVVPDEGAAFARSRVMRFAESSGLAPTTGGTYAQRAATGVTFTLQASDGSPLAQDAAAGEDVGALSLTLDVPRTPDTDASFGAMANCASRLAAEVGGRLADDNGRILDERALAAIGSQLGEVRAAFAARRIEPGSDLALRLFA